MRIKAKNRVLIYLIGVILILQISNLELLIGLLSILVVIALCNKSSKKVWQRFYFAIPFFLTIIVLGFFHTKGWQFTIQLSLKFLIIIIFNINLLSDFNENDLILAMKELKFPNLLIITIFFIFRYHKTFKAEMNRFILARKLRGRRTEKKFSIKEYSILAESIGAGVVRSIDKSDKVYQAMKLRGLNIETLIIEERE
ncbi:hypothetical protein U472_04065 [Orenia metallireducens]|jgi:cobalt/nickel transport system permease protein|uniref:Cobalt/nickel transport system permease protein n=1 Tax=Orenia metallireducens TaxID=1413210 RepID=A0A1C0ABM5_9FIRM|nr:energy-coupling factor transporter transmembrane component T [Orenia metallireducens]OCL27734.1 hypothetical protein U472_04065 [Orenia metallireducens]